MISTFKRNRHFRKVSVNKTFTHVQQQKTAMSSRHSAFIPHSVKSPLSTNSTKWSNTPKQFVDKRVLQKKKKKRLCEYSNPFLEIYFFRLQISSLTHSTSLELAGCIFRKRIILDLLIRGYLFQVVIFIKMLKQSQSFLQLTNEKLYRKSLFF